MLFGFPRLLGYADADPDEVRYFIPLAVGALPAILVCASEALLERATALSRAARMGLVVVLGLAPLVPFGSSAADRPPVTSMARPVRSANARSG